MGSCLQDGSLVDSGKLTKSFSFLRHISRDFIAIPTRVLKKCSHASRNWESSFIVISDLPQYTVSIRTQLINPSYMVCLLCCPHRCFFPPRWGGRPHISTKVSFSSLSIIASILAPTCNPWPPFPPEILSWCSASLPPSLGLGTWLIDYHPPTPESKLLCLPPHLAARTLAAAIPCPSRNLEMRWVGNSSNPAVSLNRTLLMTMLHCPSIIGTFQPLNSTSFSETLYQATLSS